MARRVTGLSSWMLVGLGGAVGAMLRFGVVRLMPTGGWPMGTFAVNVIGGFAMGLLVGWLAARGAGENVRLLLGVGVLGGFTTFSAFSLDMLLMLERGDFGLAVAYALASVMLCVLALWAGLLLVRSLA
jgi:fluoride exporter